MILAPSQARELIAHAQDEEPHECCGWMRMAHGVVHTVTRGSNLKRDSFILFELDPQSLFSCIQAQYDGWDVAVYHSHPEGMAYPSMIDISCASHPWLWVIVSGEEITAWWITDDEAVEEPVEIR